MITLVSSPKQQLCKHMQHNVHIVWFKGFLYILLKCTQVWIELGLLVKALLAWGIYCGRSLGKTTFLELCMNLGCMTNMWKNNEQKCGLDWIANTMKTNLLSWCNLVSISKNLVFYAFLVVRIYWTFSWFCEHLLNI